MNFTGQLFTPTPPTSYIGRFSVSPEQLPYISEHTTFLFAELDAHNLFMDSCRILLDSAASNAASRGLALQVGDESDPNRGVIRLP